jgi:hypothetical protein
MANPGYPPMGGPMQPTGGAPMGPMGPGGPMGPMGMGMGMGMQPVRQGTSHIVPVVVAAGLAVGVFCGLLFGLGTKHEVAPSRGSTGAKQSEESQIQTAQVSMGTKLPPRSATGSAGSAAAGATGSAAPAGNAGGSGSAAAGAGGPPGPGPGKLKIDIEPETAAHAAKVFVDGIQITGTTVDIPFDGDATKKSVKIVVKVPGYKDMEKTIEVESDASSSISFDLKGVRVIAAPDDGKAGANPGGGTTGAAGTGGGASGGGASAGGTSGGGTTGGGAKTTGGGSKGTGGSKGSGKGSGKGSSGLIDI